MDLNKNRTLISIIIMTGVFLLVSIVSVYFMFANNEASKEINKDYINMIEKELEIDITTEDEFASINGNDYEIYVMKNSNSTYVSPCFEFIIVPGKIVITRALAKEFYDYKWQVGSEIIAIDGVELKDLSYFEIEDLIYAKTIELHKEFTLSTGVKVDFGYNKYTYYSTLVEDKKIVLSIYNLDRINRKQVYDLVNEYEEVVIDLSKATITELSSIVDFLSLFTAGNVQLFSSHDIRAYKNYKLNDIQIVLGNNQDKGILFALTSIKNHNSTITFDVSLDKLTVFEYNCKKIVTGNNYKLVIYDEYVKSIDKTESDISGLCK